MKAWDATAGPMRSRERPVVLTADQLEDRASARITNAERLPPGEARQRALKNAAQLRSLCCHEETTRAGPAERRGRGK